MKKTFIAAVALASAYPLMAEPITSNVIHDYTYVGAGYGYLHDVVGDKSGNGGVAEFSYDINNIVLGVNGSYFFVDTQPSLDLWSIGGSVGYVFRAMENHLNLIPRVGVSYSEVSAGGFSDNATILTPGITLSYALSSRFAINGGYTFAYDIDSEDDSNNFNVGGVFALTECVGLNVTANFNADDGWTGIIAGATWHF